MSLKAMSGRLFFLGLGALMGVLCAVVYSIAMPNNGQLIEYVYEQMAGFVFAFLLCGLILVIFALYKGSIFEKLNKTSEHSLQDLSHRSIGLINFLLEPNKTKDEWKQQKDELEISARAVVNFVASGIAMATFMRLLFGVFAGLLAFAGTFLLLKQNEIMEQEKQLLAIQNYALYLQLPNQFDTLVPKSKEISSYHDFSWEQASEWDWTTEDEYDAEGDSAAILNVSENSNLKLWAIPPITNKIAQQLSPKDNGEIDALAQSFRLMLTNERPELRITAINSLFSLGRSLSCDSSTTLASQHVLKKVFTRISLPVVTDFRSYLSFENSVVVFNCNECNASNLIIDAQDSVLFFDIPISSLINSMPTITGRSNFIIFDNSENTSYNPTISNLGNAINKRMLFDGILEINFSENIFTQIKQFIPSEVYRISDKYREDELYQCQGAIVESKPNTNSSLLLENGPTFIEESPSSNEYDECLDLKARTNSQRFTCKDDREN